MHPPLPQKSRTQQFEGVSIPGIIHNSNYFFTDLDVYEDGRVECWNFQDFEHFKKDVQRGWVAVEIPDDKAISIHGLGEWTLTSGHWDYNKDSFIAYVWSIVQSLNPDLVNLYQYVEKKKNGITMGGRSNGKIYQEKITDPPAFYPERITAEGHNLFFQQDPLTYYLIRLDVYDDQTIVISRYLRPYTLNLEGLEALIETQKIVTEVPIGAQVKILGLGSFEIKELSYCNEIAEKLLEIKDTLKELKGEPSSLDICIELFDAYKQAPTHALKAQLKTAYESIPEHNRMYVGDMDTKDTEVRMILYGEEEIEGWSHYQVAKVQGGPLPSIKIPKLEEE